MGRKRGTTTLKNKLDKMSTSFLAAKSRTASRSASVQDYSKAPLMLNFTLSGILKEDIIMGKKINAAEFWNIAEEAAKTADQRKAELAALVDHQRSVEAELADAAMDGTLERVQELRAELDEIKGKIIVARAQIAKMPYSIREVQERFSDYAADHNAVYREKLEAYKQKRKELFQMFKELAALQNEGIKTRRKCADLTGGDDLAAIVTFPKDGKIRCHRREDCTADLAFFSALGWMDKEEFVRHYDLLDCGHPQDTLKSMGLASLGYPYNMIY